MRKHIFFAILFISTPLFLFAQKDSIQYSLQSSFLFSSKNQPPYWLVSNQQGMYSTNKNQWLVSGNIHKTLNNKKFFDYGFGFEIANRVNSKNSLWLQQGYGELKYSIFKLTAGAKNEVFGVHDTLLSSGSFIWSKNARPIPKITLSTPGFINVPFTKGLLEFSTLLSHGWFEKDRYVERPLLHHKNIYLRFGKNLPIEIIAGFDHFAMWGGKSSNPDIGEIPSDWDAFKKVIVAKSYSSVHSVERNAFGNHFGAYNLGIKYKFRENSIFVYKQHPYEDKSGLRLRNWEDGLWGISFRLKNKFIKGFIYEFVNTYDQGIEGNYTGKYDPDNYYNNYIYRNGWTINKWILGNPFIQSQQFSNTQRLFDNMLKTHYFGLSGKFEQINFQLNYNLTKFYGNIYDQYANPKNQVTYQIQTLFPVKNKLSILFTITYEHGELYKNNFGSLLTIRYDGFIKL